MRTKTGHAQNPVPHMPWAELPQRIRDDVAAQFGKVTRVVPAAHGRASDFVGTLDTHRWGKVFLKAVRTERPTVFMLEQEIVVAPLLADLAPGLLWNRHYGDWLVAAFEYADGRTADLSPGSADLEPIRDLLNELSRRTAPVSVPVACDRWGAYVPDELIAGETLAHTDLHAHNVHVGRRLWVLDWGTVRAAAPWVDTARMVIRLIADGHTPAGAERWARGVDAWRGCDPDVLDRFAVDITAARWNGYRMLAKPRPGLNMRVVYASQAWMQHRLDYP